MASITIQFHALVSELKEFTKKCAEHYDINMVAVKYFPFKVRKIGEDELDEVFDDIAYREVAFTLVPPDLSASSGLRFVEQNSDVLFLNIGRLSEKGLKESCLSTITDNFQAMKIWRKIASDLKKITDVGVIAVSSDTGIKVNAKNHRFSQGAKEFYENGVTILPIAGNVILELVGTGKWQ